MAKLLGVWSVVVLVAVACLAGRAEETSDWVYPHYIVTTVEGTNYLSEAQVEVVASEGADPVTNAFSKLEAPTTGTFFKKGPGFLVSCTDMGGFTGEWWIQEGALMVDLSGEMGPKNSTAGDVHVADGASFGLAVVTKMTSQSMAIGNRFYVSGTGYKGLGAIFNGSLASQVSNNMRSAFLNTIILEGDTMFRGWESDFGDKDSAEDAGGYQLNGHTLTLQMDSGSYLTNSGLFVDGHVILHGEWQPQSGLTFGGGTSNSLTLCSGSSWHGYHCGGIKQTTPWTLILEDGSKIAHSGNLATALKNWTSTNYDDWDGPAVVKGQATIANVSFTTNRAAYQAVFNGPVSGPGGFKVTRGWLYFNNPTNTFTGPLSVAITGGTAYYGGLGFFNKDAFPAGNTCVVSNKNGGIYVTTAKTLIPAINYETTGGYYTNAAIYGAGSVVTKSLVKRGVGELKLEAPVFVDGRTELLEGSIKLDPPRNGDLTQYSLAPGLYESMISFGTNEFPKGFVTAWYTNGENTPTNGVVSYPVLAEATGTSKGWAKQQAVRYQGYIWNRSAEPVMWSFATTFATAGKLLIDDEVITTSSYTTSAGTTGRCDWYYLRTNQVVLASGPHKFELNAYNNGYGTGGAKPAYATWNDAEGKSYGDFKDIGVPTWPSNFGLAYKEGEPSLYSTDYAIPQNAELTGREGGNGLLFTLDATPPEAHAAELARMTDENIRTADAWSSFTNLYAKAGTVIDLQGSVYSLHLESFEGSTCVSNGSVRLEGVWTLSPEAELPEAGAVLSVPQGTVTFGSNAVIRIKNGKSLRRLMRQTSGKLLDAGYEGSPALLLDPEDPTFGNWKLRAEDDGLYLDYESGTVLIIK